MWDAVRLAARSLIRNPGRSGLTVLGLAIGIAAFIAMVSFGRGAQASVVSQFEKFGVNLLTIKRHGAWLPGRVPSPLTDEDVERLEKGSTTFAHVVPRLQKASIGTYGGREYVVRMVGTTPDFVVVQDWNFDEGAMFDAIDAQRRAKVCVLGATPARELFGAENPLGRTFTVEGLRCRVIGLLESKGTATSGRDLDDVVLLPVPTFRAYLSGFDPSFTTIEVQPRSPQLRAEAEREIEEILRRTHRLAEDADNDFAVRSPDDATRTADQVADILTGLLAGIAGVSLLVGGIGIMNIQLVAVAERTREIGIRSAIGATPAQIRLQFLTEAVLLAAAGTLFGALLGVGIAIGVAQAMQWPASVPFGVVLISVVFGSSVGVLFGFLPARRASRLDPIEALRRE